MKGYLLLLFVGWWVTCGCVAPVGAESHLMRYADVHEDQIVFTYEGDLWLVSSEGGDARRITNDQGSEWSAKFSPDGSKLAFTAQYDGGTDIYVMDARGGVPVRLTYHPAMDRVLDWFPDGGRLGIEYLSPPTVTGLFLIDSLLAGQLDVFRDALWHLVLPGVTLALANIAIITRMTRSSLMEVMHQDYIRTARSKGLTAISVLGRHAMKNAMVPVVTVIGLQLGYLIAWVFLVEYIFSWPGIGSYAVRCIVNLDFPAVQGVTLFTSFVFVFINLAVDLIYLFLDPRITY